MKLEKTPGGYALYKEKTIIGTCQARPTEQGADITALTIVPEWRRKGYGSYLLKEVLRSLGGYDKESATVFTAPLPADAGELAFWAKFGFAAEGSCLLLICGCVLFYGVFLPWAVKEIIRLCRQAAGYLSARA